MTMARLSLIAPIAAAVVGALVIGQWLWSARSVTAVEKRIPLEDQSLKAGGIAVDLAGVLKTGDGVAGDLKGAWLSFRGDHQDNINSETIKLARQWSAGGPPKLWEVETGEGYAGASVWNGRAYFLDYDETAHADVLRCLSTSDGKEIWRRGYSIDIGRNHGISRTVCAVADGRVVSFGPKCHIVCLDAVSGDFKWGIDMVKEYKTTVPPWYAGQNPLIENGRVILAPGGDSLLVAIDLATGKPVWKTPNPKKWEMTHSSVATMVIGGRKTYVYCASAGVVGVSAEEGKVLFELPDWKVSMANVPTPLPLPGDRMLLTGGYGAGSMMVKLEAGEAGKIIPKVLFRLKPEVFGAEQHTPVFYKGYIYGVIPVSSQLVCLNLDGKVMWASGGKYRFGLGPFMVADGMVMVMNDAGTMTMVEADPAGFKVLGQGKLFDHGHDAWGPMALVGGRLFARDMTRLGCFDLREVTR